MSGSRNSSVHPSESLTTVSTYGPSGPSSRVRLDDWLAHLGLRSEDLRYAGLPNMRPKTAARHPFRVLGGEARARSAADVRRQRLVLSREASPFSHGGLEEKFLRSAQHSAYDIDDALFEDGQGLRRVYGKPEKCRRAAKAADVVIAGNDYLANWAADHNRDVRVIPSCVDVTLYQAKTSWDLSERPVLVWLGSPTTEIYLEAIAPQLRRLHEQTGARLRIISKARRHEIQALDGMVDRHVWSLETVPGLLATSDVALGPLDDSPFGRGKCAYKLLQYAASALPMVGSPVGANRLALQRFSGVSVDSGESWFDAIASVLAESSEARGMRGKTSLEAVHEHYSFAAWDSDWKVAVGFAR
jgi:hypothetical protein